MYAGMTSEMIGVKVEQERKLLRIPRGVGNLQAEVRVFEEERGCSMREILVNQDGFIQVLRLVGLAGLMEVRVHLQEVREGHMVLGGCRNGRQAAAGIGPGTSENRAR